MSINQIIISVLVVTVSSGLLAITGLKKQPGIGVIGAIIIAAFTLWYRREALTVWGLSQPSNWFVTLLLGFGLGFLIQLITIVLIEPLSEKLTGTRHDHSALDNVRGNWKALIQWLIIVWVLVAFLEEGIYRGFLMTEIARIIGKGPLSLAVNVTITSIIFGLSHGYQSRSGIVSTGVVGGLLAIIYVLNDFNLWMPIFVHGFIDTIGIGLIAINGDRYIREKIWKPAS